MEFHRVFKALILLFTLTRFIGLSSCQVVKGKVSCSQCDKDYDFSDIKVLVKCDKVKKIGMATTEKDGTFEARLPSDHTPCLAKLLGGPNQLYAARKNMVSNIVKTQDTMSYTTSTLLSFSTTCPAAGRDGKCHPLESSKTIDLPLPREWGLAPTSYYVPFFPIIGIP